MTSCFWEKYTNWSKNWCYYLFILPHFYTGGALLYGTCKSSFEYKQWYGILSKSRIWLVLYKSNYLFIIKYY